MDSKFAKKGALKYGEVLYKQMNPGSSKPKKTQIDKPVVTIINTYSSSKAQNSNTSDVGSHWICSVLLPKGYVGLHVRNPYDNQVWDNCLCQSEPLANEKFYLIDSLKSKREFPHVLKDVLQKGHISKRVPADEKFDSLLSKDVQCFALTNKAQQSKGDNNCGYWSLFNALMLIFQGCPHFYEHMHNIQTVSIKRRMAGCYLRKFLNSCAPLGLRAYFKPEETLIEVEEFEDNKSLDDIECLITEEDESIKEGHKNIIDGKNLKSLSYLKLDKVPWAVEKRTMIPEGELQDQLQKELLHFAFTIDPYSYGLCMQLWILNNIRKKFGEIIFVCIDPTYTVSLTFLSFF